MDMKKIAGICILIPVLLTGCGSKADTETTAASTSQPQQQTAKAADGQQQNRPAMDPAQRQLFSSFQILMMLDKADGLTITKEQAQAMLPVAQDIIAKKELSDENKTKLLSSLTEAQKKFITDAETRMSNRGNGGNGGPNGQGQGQGQGQRQGQRQGQAPDASATPKANAGDGAGKAQQGGGKRPNGNGGGNANEGGQNGGGGFGGNRPAGGQMGNIGEQFVELLQTKLK